MNRKNAGVKYGQRCLQAKFSHEKGSISTSQYDKRDIICERLTLPPHGSRRPGVLNLFTKVRVRHFILLDRRCSRVHYKCDYQQAPANTRCQVIQDGGQTDGQWDGDVDTTETTSGIA